MKRLASLLALAVLTGIVPASAQEPPVGAFGGGGLFQEAWLDWMEIEGDRGTWYIVAGTRRVTTDGVGTYALLAKGRCKIDRGKRWTSISCFAHGRVRELRTEDFQFDPMLGSASVRIDDGKLVHRVEWTGAGPGPEPGVGQGVYASPWGTDVYGGGGFYRWAETSGRAFGRPVGKAGLFSSSYLGESAGGGAFAYTGDLIPLTRTVRVPS